MLLSFSVGALAVDFISSLLLWVLVVVLLGYFWGEYSGSRVTDAPGFLHERAAKAYALLRHRQPC